MTKTFLLTLFAGVALVAPIRADDLDRFAAEIKTDQALAGQDAETVRLQHDAEMVKDMERRDQEVRAAHEAYNRHLQEWIEASRPKQVPNLVTRDNRGNVTETFDNSHPILSPR